MNTLILLTSAGFPVLTVLFFTILYKQVSKAIHQTAWTAAKKTRIQNRFLFALLLWAGIVSLASLSGFSGNFDLFPFNVLPFLGIPMVVILVAVFSQNTSDILAFIPPKFLTNLQVFRVFVEIFLWAYFVQSLLPIQMTFEGRNLDILSGIFGPVVGLLLIRNNTMVWAYNILGMALLINIVTTAILSMPSPFQVFTEGPSNTLVFGWPGIFLPTFLVPLAYGLHFLSMRQLALRK